MYLLMLHNKHVLILGMLKGSRHSFGTVEKPQLQPIAAYLAVSPLVTSFGFLSAFKKFSNADGIGKSAIDEIWASSFGVFVSVRFLLSAKTASSSSTFTFVISLVSCHDFGKYIAAKLPEPLVRLSLLVLRIRI